MSKSESSNLIKKGNKLFTKNKVEKEKVYGERLERIKNKEYRSWNPYRSKLAAAILKGYNFEINPNSNVLYLGAATGTTVSHISDILEKGTIYAVENSAIAIKDLIKVSEKRKNIIPILEDANHPDRYSVFTSNVDLIYQDISQRNQAEIFVNNINFYLKKEGLAIIMVKARSIDVSLTPKKAYQTVISYLEKHNLKVTKTMELSAYQKDHAAIIVKN